MSSVLLYLAIVVMWLCVLVPMWLRRDRNNLAELEETYELTGPLPVAPRAPIEEDHHDTDSEQLATPAPTMDARQFHARRRAIIVARRRRLLFFCTLLILASVITAAVKVIPWWGIAPSCVLLLAHLSVLRIAVRVDRERRQRAREARAERLRRLRARRQAELLAAQQAEAEIIEFTARQGDALFDQYAEPPRRAVGD
ncbi:hypothetical protein [Nonomuraea sp. NPDC046570]|uniref:divisome protein SepX/GlpR n=1 Tax=Nonomuraea sp. NPDC046570 TaxID=3155255 RepID=UPI0033D97DA3